MSDSLRLFLVEDDDDIALLVRKSLERAGHYVTACHCAADALIVLAQYHFDLVLLEQRLPDLSGLALIEQMAREGVHIPVLMVTAHGDEKLAAQVLRAGALDYIVKDDSLTFLAELPKRVVDAVTRHRLVQSNELHIQALESARDGVMITDLSGTILHVNRALEELTGYHRDELIGQTPRLFKSEEHPPALFAEMWRTVLARASWQGELTNRRKDCVLYQVSLTVSPIIDGQGRLTHFVGIQRDITAHKQLEKQLLQAQKMQSIGTLAGGVAHEFNNLLAGINGYAALGLREKGLTPTLIEFLRHIVDLSERAATLTRQLLAFARKPSLIRNRTGIVDLVRRTAELATRSLQIQIRLDLGNADENELVVQADSNQLQQALINLALNARDALRERAAIDVASGRPWNVSIRVWHAVLVEPAPGFPQQVPPGDYVVVEVEDEGMGMAPEVLSRSLDPFFTTKEVGQGTGLGLPMVFGIVTGHQGFLLLDSVLGRGTRASLYLPRLREPTTAAGLPEEIHSAELLEPEIVPGRSILVIDDEEAVLDVVRRFLEIAGHAVAGVSRGQEALDLLAANQRVDLIILDLMMPREDVRLLFQRLRQRRPSVPVLLCTGLPHAEPSSDLLDQPGVGLIRKPFRMNELWYAVREALLANQIL